MIRLLNRFYWLLILTVLTNSDELAQDMIRNHPDKSLDITTDASQILSEETCNSSKDCQPGRHCVSARCLNTQCISDSDCPFSSQCISSECSYTQTNRKLTSKDGVHLQSPVRVESGLEYASLSTDAAMLSNGTIVVVWLVEGTPPPGSALSRMLNDWCDIVAETFDSSGNPVASSFTIASSVDKTTLMAVESLNNGYFIVIWEDSSANSIDTMIFDSAGILSTGPSVDGSVSSGNTKPPSISSHAPGEFFVVWQNGSSIKGQLYTGNNTPQHISSITVAQLSQANPQVVGLASNRSS